MKIKVLEFVKNENKTRVMIDQSVKDELQTTDVIIKTEFNDMNESEEIHIRAFGLDDRSSISIKNTYNKLPIEASKGIYEYDRQENGYYVFSKPIEE